MEKRTHLGFHSYSPASVLRVTGDDSAVFLQGQFSQELRQSAQRPVVYGLWLTQKGKVLADSFVLQEASQRFWVVSTFSPARVIQERLESYVVADDVTIEDLTAEFEALTVVGVEADAWLESQRPGVPLPLAGSYASAGAEGREDFLFRGRRENGENWEWLRRKAAGSTRWSCDPALEWTEAELERLRIESGLPRVPVDVGPGDLPQEADLDVSAVSYAKGCYLGQEVMARLRAMGQVRRRLLRVRGAGAVPEVLPTALLAKGKKIGELRSAVPTGNGLLGFAMVSLVGLDLEAPIFLADRETSSLRFDPLQP